MKDKFDKLPEKTAVLLGFLTTLFTSFFIFEIFMGDCFFEQGCGKYEYVKISGIFFLSCFIGFGVSLITIKIMRQFEK